jgi:hypothetical protein
MGEPPVRDWPPKIHTEGLPEKEREAAAHIEAACLQLATFANQFRAALHLFDFVTSVECQMVVIRNPQWRVEEWKFIAAREGAMSIYHFAKALEDIMACLNKSPTVLGLVRRPEIRKARKLLRKHFPKFETVRHAVAHAGELMREPGAYSRHVITGPVVIGDIYFGGTFGLRDTFVSERKFVNTFEGAVQEYEISQATLHALTEIRMQFFAAFRDVEAATLAMIGPPADHATPKGPS